MSPSTQKMTIIVAATQSMGIGIKGGLPWKLPGEMKYFARATTGPSELPVSASDGTSVSSTSRNSVIMGRKTWESIPPKFRPLKGRTNVIVSRDPGSIDLEGCEETKACGSLREAMDMVTPSTSASTTSPSSSTEVAPTRSSTTFLVGGAQLYTLALQQDLVSRILLTRIISPAFEECDVHLPDFTLDKRWQLQPHAELERFVGFDVKEGEVEEKGVRYRFELWERH